MFLRFFYVDNSLLLVDYKTFPMSHLPLRSEKNCLNCGAEVEERFCPNCGQENVEVRPKFHHLISHFFADLFHYDSGFWKTMKTLLFRPGVIVNDYLSGKRKTYVEPVKLYIFVSFVAFFLPHFLPNFASDETMVLKQSIETNNENSLNIITVEQLDSIQNSLDEKDRIPADEYPEVRKRLEQANKIDQGLYFDEQGKFHVNLFDKNEASKENYEGITLNNHYKNIKTVEQFDSVHQSLSTKKRMNWITKKLSRKIVEIQEQHIYHEFDYQQKLKETFLKNLPKVIFFYLPIFAFTIWLFHNKKKWLYYDHGIFTLYFMSAMLVFITINSILNSILSIPGLVWAGYQSLYDILTLLVGLVIIGYSIFYFFRAHHVVYESSAWRSRFVVLILLFLNGFIVLAVGILYSIFTFMLI
jgi:hypothetical protein